MAIASTDFIAADRVGLEAMGIDSAWVGYLRYRGECGLGQYELSQIEVRGAALAAVRRSYRRHPNIQRELRWREPGPESVAPGVF